MKKVVDGVEVEMSAQEEGDFISFQTANAPNQSDLIKRQIEKLEIENKIQLRAQRELFLVVRELFKEVTGSYPTNPNFDKAATLETQIAALRAQL